MKESSNTYCYNGRAVTVECSSLSWSAPPPIPDFSVSANLSKETMKAEHRAIEDLEHQLRGPLSAALARLNYILREKKFDSSLEKEILAIRGLCRKANRVAESARLFVLFDSPEPQIRLNRMRISNDGLRRMLVECAQDNEILLSPERRITIKCDLNGFDSIREFYADPELLQQAINNLLDNAGKYSFPNTTVLISAQCAKEKVFITVVNQGIRIRPQELSTCLTRGWRGQESMMVTGEGSGIGLWVVDRIMKAHEGAILISPTDTSNQTSVRLEFPVRESS